MVAQINRDTRKAREQTHMLHAHVTYVLVNLCYNINGVSFGEKPNFALMLHHNHISGEQG